MKWGLPLAALTAGISLRDCLVLSAARPLALGAFYLGMDADSPGDAFRASIRSALAGIGAMLAAAALALATVAAILGYWQPSHGPILAGAGLLAVSAGAFLAISAGEGPWRPRPAVWMSALLAGAALIASGPPSVFSEWSVCALPIATSALMAIAGWRLLREVATGLLGAGREPWP